MINRLKLDSSLLLVSYFIGVLLTTAIEDTPARDARKLRPARRTASLILPPLYTLNEVNYSYCLHDVRW